MTGTIANTIAEMEQKLAANEVAMNAQISEMESTMTKYESDAANLESDATNLESQAAAQDVIAATAMKTEYYTDSSGKRRSRQVPDTAKREAAKKKATELRDKATKKRGQAAKLRDAAAKIAAAVSKLRREVARLNKRIRDLIANVQDTDLAYAQMLLQINAEIAAFTDRINEIYNSFSDSFPLNSGLLSGLGQIVGNLTALGSDLMSQLAGVVASCVFSKDPINMATGNFIYDKNDIAITGRFPLVFKRFYNSIDETDGVLGKNWTHNYNIKLTDKGDSVRIAFDDGHTETYHLFEDEMYLAPMEHLNILRKIDGGYMLVFPSMERYLFDPEGKLISILDLNGNTTSLTHENGLVVKVSTDCGSLSFTYNQDRRITEALDHTGRTVSYEYSGNLLTSATHPSGAVYRYEYGKDDKISNLINPLSICTVHNEYDEYYRTVKQSYADGGVAFLNYDDNRMMTTETEQNGNIVQYFRDEKYRSVKTVYADSEERFEYNDNNKRTLHADRNGNVRRYEYDIRGNVIKHIDSLNNAVSAEYSSLNKPVKITNPDGGVITFTYDERGNLTSFLDPLERTMRFSRDDRGLVTEHMMPDGSKNTVSYDERGNITAITDTDGNKTLYEYNSLNRVIKSISPEGHATRFEYNVKGDISKATNSEGNARVYEYNANGKLTKLVDFDGGVTEYTYNKLGKIEEIINQSNNVTKFTYDLMWNLTGVTDPLGNVLRYEYNQLGRMVKSIDQEGNSTEYEYDPKGNITAIISSLGARTEIKYDALDRQIEIREADGAVTKFFYDAAGNPTKVIDPQGGAITRIHDMAGQLLSETNPMGNATTYTHTALGQIETVTDALDGKTVYSYYLGGKLKSVTKPGGESETYEYDKNGNIIKITDALDNSTTLIYDCMDRVCEIINPLNHSRKFAYDAVGNITQIIDENGNETKYKYSLTKDVIEATDALGNSTKYDYDKAGRLSKVEQYRLIDPTIADIMQIELQATSYERNKKGEITAVHSPLGDVVRYKYDGGGNLMSKLDEDNLETLYEYNFVGKLSKVMYADGKTVELSYNALRQLTEMKDWLGTTSIDMDSFGRIEAITDFEGKTVQYEWDTLGRRTTTIYPDDSKVGYNWSETGRLDSVVSGTGVTNYTYDAMGRISERLLPDSTTTKYELNPLGRLTSLTHSKDDGILDQFKYSYDPAGNITSIDKHRAGVEADSGLFEYAYDPLSRLVSAIHGDKAKEYRYDSLGNRISSLQNGIETKHSYNSRNQLIRTEESGAVSEYLYDKRGNLTSITKNGTLESKYDFDATNMMVSAFSEGKGKAEYSYNGFLKRVKKLETLQGVNMPDPTQEMRYILDLTKPYNNLLATEGAQNQNFVWGNELLSSSGDESFHYLNDHLGSPIRLLGETEIDTLAYDEFGVPLVGAGKSINQPFGFTAYQTDDVSGLYYAQARFYDPTASRMISEDTHWHTENMIFGDIPSNRSVPDMDAIMQSANLYAYCRDNPIAFYDLTGNKGQSASSEKQPSSNPRAPHNKKPLSYGQSSEPSLANDLRNFDLLNTDPLAAKDAKYISAYKGQVVIIHDVPWPDRAASAGVMVLPRNAQDWNPSDFEALIRHEYGHFLQLSQVGPDKYLLAIFLPSAVIGAFLDYDTYYSMPWEIIADMLGKVERQNYDYLPFSELIGLLYHAGLSNNDVLSLVTQLLEKIGAC